MPNVLILGLKEFQISQWGPLMSALTEKLLETWRELGVDQKSHGLADCAQDNRVIDAGSGVFNGCSNIGRFQIRKISEDFFFCTTASEHVEDILHTNAQPTNTWPTPALSGIYRDSGVSLHMMSLAFLVMRSSVWGGRGLKG